MQKKKVFISSVQSEFADGRQMLSTYLQTDALLVPQGQYFINRRLQPADKNTPPPHKALTNNITVPCLSILCLPSIMYWNGTIERIGTGTRDIVKLCKNLGLKEPEFIQEEF
jgi:hypothetical protein